MNMGSFQKKLLSFAAVAFVSSAISVGAYALISNESSSRMTDMDIIGTEQRVAGDFVRVSNMAPQTMDFTQIAEKSVNAVVSIKSTITPKQTSRSRIQDPFFEFFFGPGREMPTPQQQPRIGTGSGVIISSDGYIITNNHVIEGADKIDITLNDKRAFNAKVIGSDPSTDLALLKIEAKGLPMMKFGNSDLLKVGEWVLAVGNPMGLTSTVTAGIVSAKGRSIGTGKSMSIESYIQTDAAVNPGNSGGALVNTNGELVGINTMIVSQTGSYIGYSFAVPSNIAIKIVSDLKKYGCVQRAMLGVTIREMTAELAEEKDIDFVAGVYIVGVEERGSAKEAGLKEGDIIVAVDGTGIASVARLQEEISLHNPGDKVAITVVRDGKRKNIDVVLKNLQGDTSITQPTDFTSLGAAFSELTDKQKESYGISAGVEVTATKEGKFQRAGIRKGFIILNINGEIIYSPDTIERIYDDIQKSSSRDKVMFITGIYPNGKSAYYAVDLASE